MFDEDDLAGSYQKVNPKAKKKKAVKSPITPKKHIVAQVKTPARTTKAVLQVSKSAKSIQDQAGEYERGDTIVVHKTGDEYWSILKVDADKLTDHQIFAYMYRRFGYQAHLLDILRPKQS